jgi:glycosyltransferase involved in cell wall biosynthesis
MKILFLDQSGKIGGAELSLADIASFYRDRCLVGLLADGAFRELLEDLEIPVKVLTDRPIRVSKESNPLQALASLRDITQPIARIVKLARDYDLLYANTQKALVLGAVASTLSRRPLVYHLRDILSPDHFSRSNCRIAVTLANLCTARVIANSQATRSAFIEAGGRADLVEVVYNGFDPERYIPQSENTLRQELGLEGKYIVGHFSRLSPWKGQHILLNALRHCPAEVSAILVGDALFGEQDYVKHLHNQVEEWGLGERVQFLGFRSDIVPLMGACDSIVHTSTAPEPFGRVIVEAMLCQRPIIAAAAGGAIELIESGETGWLVPPGDAIALAKAIAGCVFHPEVAETVALRARQHALDRFPLERTIAQIDRVLQPLSLGSR